MKINIFNAECLLLAAVFLPALGLMTNCARSSETKAIIANQSNGTSENQSFTPTPSPNIKKMSESAPVDLSKAQPVSYCELVENAAKYDHQIVRLRAIYFNAFERTYLYDESCKNNQPPTAPEKVPAQTWAQWDKSLVSVGDSEEAKTNRQLNGFGRKDVTVIGRFDSTNEQGDSNMPNLFGHMNCCRYQFLIMKLEKLNSDIKK
jgi:hypothetical protein